MVVPFTVSEKKCCYNKWKIQTLLLSALSAFQLIQNYYSALCPHKEKMNMEKN